jgi:hypothetical protein
VQVADHELVEANRPTAGFNVREATCANDIQPNSDQRRDWAGRRRLRGTLVGRWLRRRQELSKFHLERLRNGLRHPQTNSSAVFGATYRVLTQAGCLSKPGLRPASVGSETKETLPIEFDRSFVVGFDRVLRPSSGLPAGLLRFSGHREWAIFGVGNERRSNTVGNDEMWKNCLSALREVANGKIEIIRESTEKGRRTTLRAERIDAIIALLLIVAMFKGVL